MPDDVLLEVERISQEFPAPGKPNRVLQDVSFRADRASTLCLLGPSGCGKSTVLRMISGMYDRRARMPTAGAVRIRGRVVDGPHDEVLTVFQRPVLKAWLNVRDNVALPFRAGLWGDRVTRPTAWETYPEMTRSVEQASDHSAVFIELDI